MTMPLVRRANKADVPLIVAFNAAMAEETEGLSLDPIVLQRGVEEIFRNPQHGFYIVCEIDNVVHACLMITYEWSDWRNGQFWWIQSVYVQKEFRQQGLYKQMYEFIKTEVKKSKGIAGIRLYVDHNNDKAKEVYKKSGMKKSNYELFEYIRPGNTG